MLFRSPQNPKTPEYLRVERITRHSCHFHLLVLDLLGCLLGQLVHENAVKDFVGEASVLAEDADLKLLLLFLHFFLRFEQDLNNVWKSMLNAHFAEVLFLNLVPCKLLASATSTSIVLKACAGRFNHKQTVPLQVIMSC